MKLFAEKEGLSYANGVSLYRASYKAYRTSVRNVQKAPLDFQKKKNQDAKGMKKDKKQEKPSDKVLKGK